MQQPFTRHDSERGFTLVEMIVVMVIIGILAALGGMFIARPIEGFLDLSRRATLVDAADNALRRMQRDIRQALPNSVRIMDDDGVWILELLLTEDGGRYRARGSGDLLDFTKGDASFDVLGNLNQAPPADQNLVVYNLTATGIGGNAYRGDNRAVVGADSTVAKINLDSATKFPRSSPYQRFFLLNGPVSYVCDPSLGTLTRHDSYAISIGQSTDPGGTAALMTRHVTACSFSYAAGTAQRAGLVTMRLQLADEGETITLFHQVHVDNAP